MNTIMKEIDPSVPDPETVSLAGRILKAGGLVAFPTETVYGLGGNALDPAAARKIYQAKGRPSDNPLIIHIEKTADLDVIAREIPPAARQLADQFWPGPLTIILKKTDQVPEGITGGLETVAVRMPDHPAALAIIRAAGGFVAAPSANASGRPSPTEAGHVAADLSGRIDMIIDGGPVGVGLESTIVDLTEETAVVLRPGAVTLPMLEAVLGEVCLDPAILGSEIRGVPKAPGMKYRHYAPKGELFLVAGDPDKVSEKINQLACRHEAKGQSVGIIAAEETKADYRCGLVKSIGARRDEAGIARHLYRVLREFDEADTAYIYSECFDGGEMGQAIMNRLKKAAAHRIIRV